MCARPLCSWGLPSPVCHRRAVGVHECQVWQLPVLSPDTFPTFLRWLPGWVYIRYFPVLQNVAGVLWDIFCHQTKAILSSTSATSLSLADFVLPSPQTYPIITCYFLCLVSPLSGWWEWSVSRSFYVFLTIYCIHLQPQERYSWGHSYFHEDQILWKTAESLCKGYVFKGSNLILIPQPTSWSPPAGRCFRERTQRGLNTSSRGAEAESCLPVWWGRGRNLEITDSRNPEDSKIMHVRSWNPWALLLRMTSIFHAFPSL